jgi:hypothetical protein
VATSAIALQLYTRSSQIYSSASRICSICFNNTNAVALDPHQQDCTGNNDGEEAGNPDDPFDVGQQQVQADYVPKDCRPTNLDLSICYQNVQIYVPKTVAICLCDRVGQKLHSVSFHELSQSVELFTSASHVCTIL